MAITFSIRSLMLLVAVVGVFFAFPGIVEGLPPYVRLIFVVGSMVIFPPGIFVTVFSLLLFIAVIGTEDERNIIAENQERLFRLVCLSSLLCMPWLSLFCHEMLDLR